MKSNYEIKSWGHDLGNRNCETKGQNYEVQSKLFRLKKLELRAIGSNCEIESQNYEIKVKSEIWRVIIVRKKLKLWDKVATMWDESRVQDKKLWWE